MDSRTRVVTPDKSYNVNNGRFYGSANEKNQKPIMQFVPISLDQGVEAF